MQNEPNYTPIPISHKKVEMVEPLLQISNNACWVLILETGAREGDIC